MVDADGLLVKNRKQGKLDSRQTNYAKDSESIMDLGEIVKKVKPSVIKEYI